MNYESCPLCGIAGGTVTVFVVNGVEEVHRHDVVDCAHRLKDALLAARAQVSRFESIERAMRKSTSQEGAR